MIKRLSIGLCILLTACSTPDDITDFGLDKSGVKSGYEFITLDSQALQKDEFSNPGYLWVEKGKQAFSEFECKTCHADSDFTTTAGSFPKISELSQKLINVQGQINECRTERQSKTPLPYESEEMLGLVSFVKNQSLDQPLNYILSPDLQRHFENGKDYFFRRRGQFNLSCAQCHDDHWGTKMRGDTVSQGHINGFPTFRNDWQTLGSAHRRFQACNEGLRAQTSELGSLEYLQLEVYLMARGLGLKNETPSIRR